MTIDEVIEKMPKDGWASREPNGEGVIRRNGRECPITSLTGQDSTQAYEAAKKLGIAYGDLFALVTAADGYWPHDAALRRRLLEACGLEKVEK